MCGTPDWFKNNRAVLLLLALTEALYPTLTTIIFALAYFILPVEIVWN